MIVITNDIIDYHQLTEDVRSPDAGAVVLFLGTVREMTHGRQTVALDYEAFPEMAQARMEQLESEAREQWPVTEARIAHRLGHLELGDISVAVAVSCPHRKDAFEAGRFLIDRLKEEVPIWKKENWVDGSTEWVHPGTGEPIASVPTPSVVDTINDPQS
jgi:molybdopterin synthase catalytic subunit